MTPTAKFQLNPLANAFIPISRDKPRNLQQSTKSSIKVNIILDRNKSKNSDWKSDSKKSKEMAVTWSLKNSPWIDVFFLSSISSMVNSFLNSFTFKGQFKSMTSSSTLPMLPECERDSGEVMKCNSEVVETLEATEENAKCNCPPMFGWIIPPELIGSPFNFKSECCKKYPHNSNFTEKQSYFDKIDKKINDLTLDQCYSELKSILADVYETISFKPDPISKTDEKCKDKNLFTSDCEISNKQTHESKGHDWGSTCKVSTELELVDDGCHPLLQASPLRGEDDEKELVKNVETILGKTLMHSSVPERVTLKPGTVCDPPCSVWCDFLPAAAKDTFKKYVQKTVGSKDFQKACPRMSFKSYKRSFSADDAVVLARRNRALDSRNMLLSRKDQNLSFRSTSEINKMQESVDLRERYSFNSNVDKPNMWGKFDGVDSLWQPLPDCTPMNVQYQKLNCNKKGREIRCQKLN